MREGYVSIIVPVYQSAEYLRRCVQSIMEQTYKKLQILLIDDGSTDESGSICDELALKDSRIEVYHIENRGVSDTRNFGLAKVRGEYIQFVDGDDYIHKNMTKMLVQKIEKDQADMVVCNYIKDFQKVTICNRCMEPAKKYTNVKYLCNTLRDPGHHYYGVVWNKLYRVQVIEKYQLLFSRQVDLGEDFIFNLHYWLNCQSISVIHKHLYYYNKENNASLSNIKCKKIVDCERELQNRKVIYQYYQNIFKELGLYQKLYVKIAFYWVIFYIRQKYGLLNEYNDWSEEDKRNWDRQLQENEEIRKSLKNVSKRKIKRYSLWYHMNFQLKRTIKKIGGII